MKTKPKKPIFQLNPPDEILDPALAEARKAFLTEPEARKKLATEPKPEPEAQSQPKPKREKGHFPWEAPGANRRIIKQLQVRLPEPDYLMLKYVVDNSKLRSIHAFMVQAIMQAAEKDLKKISASD